MPVSVTPAKPLQQGSANFTLALNIPVTFASPMPDTNYSVYFQPLAGLSTALSATNLTTAGFTIGLGLALSGTIKWIAIEN